MTVGELIESLRQMPPHWHVEVAYVEQGNGEAILCDALGNQIGQEINFEGAD